MATRTRKSVKEKAAESSAANLIAALEFISIAQRDAGEPRQTFCQMADGLIFGQDGAMSAGCKIEESITAFAHTKQLLAALKKCSDQITMVQAGDGKSIKIKSGKFSASIPCYNEFDKHNFPKPMPDDRIANVTNALKDALKACYPVVNESSPHPHAAGVLIQSGSVVSTNGVLLVEYWHGIDLPPCILLPKSAAAAIANCPKNLTGFGFSDRSATFYFEDDSFIKSQLFECKYPNFEKLFDREFTLTPAPEDLFKGLDHVLHFSPNGLVYFDADLIKSAPMGNVATYEVAGLPERMGFNGSFLKLIEKHFKNVEFFPKDYSAYFFNEAVRGVIKGTMIQQNDAEDDIPF